ITEDNAEAPGQQITRTVVKQITVTHLALCILIAFATAVAAKNVPGLMEMALLERLPFDPSTRYAITSLTQYAIAIVGIVLAFGAIGIGWSKVQWIATALTFGLAFGLQEIFANFVAGLILLFERPIRVGDVVTVDDVTGVVSRIRIRATTITNWDRKEFIIPNKDFITGRLLNWTLSDKVNRIVIQVGVAYGSDTDQVQKLLLKVATEHPLIMDEPAPSAIFDGFGDSTLNFTLRCYLPNLDNRLTVTHELHTAIDREFRAAGIEIAFPQRDLHICSVPESLASKLSDALSGSGETASDAGDKSD
ncbi:MAG TPA: mechanosensitive ion channel, partial [Planctomycetaceae bacterium]|nr:mechanosensitive ion channel [Planctomycetaceae bacterium]